jgi:TRAP-type C4-dicarboxylate transport system permease small subunit
MENIFKTLNSIVEKLLIFIFGLMVIDVIWQVASRYLLSKPSSFTEELARFLLIWLVVLGAAYLNGQKKHLSMDFLLNKLSPDQKVKRLKIIEIMMALFAFVVMVIGGGNLVFTTLLLGQESPALHMPLGYIYAIVPFSGLLILFYSFYNYQQLKS